MFQLMVMDMKYLCFVAMIVCCCSGQIAFCEQTPTLSSTENRDPELSAWHDKALSAVKSGELFRARKQYLELIAKFPNAPDVNGFQKELWVVNIAIIHSPLKSRQTEIYTIEKGDTLGKIARKIGTTIELIKRRNQMETHTIINGHKLSIWKGTFNILIDKSENILTLKTGDEVIKKYQVSTGKNNSSPVGQFVIKYRYEHPVWFHKGEVVPADDPKNFLGTRWLGFNLPKYGIHGTIEPEHIGKQVSSGCIRMRNEDVQELYDLIPLGTAVTIQD